MTADEFSEPLGLDRKQKPPFRISAYRAAIAASAIVALAFLASAFVARHHSGGGASNAPTAAVPAVSSSKPEQSQQSERAAAGSEVIEDTRGSREPVVLPAPPPARTVTIIDGTSGKRQEVVIPAWTDSGNADLPAAETQRRSSTGKTTTSPIQGGR